MHPDTGSARARTRACTLHNTPTFYLRTAAHPFFAAHAPPSLLSGESLPRQPSRMGLLLRHAGRRGGFAQQPRSPPLHCHAQAITTSLAATRYRCRILPTAPFNNAWLLAFVLPSTYLPSNKTFFVPRDNTLLRSFLQRRADYADLMVTIFRRRTVSVDGYVVWTRAGQSDHLGLLLLAAPTVRDHSVVSTPSWVLITGLRAIVALLGRATILAGSAVAAPATFWRLPLNLRCFHSPPPPPPRTPFGAI